MLAERRLTEEMMDDPDLPEADYRALLADLRGAIAHSDPEESIRELAETRWAARSAKDWATSDKLRDELATQGWAMKDGKDSYELSKV